MKKAIKSLMEKVSGCKVYRRNFLPRGTDLVHDIDRCFGVRNFRVVFDVGANVGQSAIRYVTSFPNADVFSFEPVSSTFKELERNTRHLGNRSHLVQSGMGSTKGTAEIHINKNSQVNSILHHTTSTKETIAVDTIDAFMSEHKTGFVDFLKIDTEGYELEVLAGAKDALEQQRVGMLLIEAEPVQTENHFVSYDQLQKSLSTYGYKLFGIYEQQIHWEGKKDLLFFNLAFVSEKLAGKQVGPETYPGQ